MAKAKTRKFIFLTEMYKTTPVTGITSAIFPLYSDWEGITLQTAPCRKHRDVHCCHKVSISAPSSYLPQR